MGNQGARLALLVSMVWAGFAMVMAGPASGAIDLRQVQAPVVAPSQPAAAGAQGTSALSSTTKPAPQSLYVEGQAIVRFERGATSAQRRALHRTAGTRVIRKLLLPDTYLVEFSPGRRPPDVARRYERNAKVRYAEPNHLRFLESTLPNDPSFGEQWGLHNVGQTVNGSPGTENADIGVTNMWDVTRGSNEVVVGVVDTGVSLQHTDLADNIYTNPDDPPGGGDQDGNGIADDTNGYDFLDGDTNPADTYGHGSHMAGIIGASGNNGYGVAGVNWDVSIAPLRVCDAVGCDDAAIADAFTYAGREGIPIVNASLGRSSDPPDVGPIYSNTISAAITASPNTLFVAAAGNGGNDEVGDNNDLAPQYPCNYTHANVLCVAATDRSDKLASFSNYGPTSVDVAAPGQYILSTWRRQNGEDRYAFQSGSSQATAMVAGAAALDLAQNPGRTTAQLKSTIVGNAQTLSSLTGRVASGRLQLASPPPATLPPPDPPPTADTTFSGGDSAMVQAPGSTQTVLSDVARQADGKIVVAGFATLAGGNIDFAVARLNANGTLDTTFSFDGWQFASFGPSTDYATALTIQGDGKIVVTGQVQSTGDFGLARFNTNGTLDTSFDTEGLVAIDTGGVQDIPNAVAVHTDGKIAVAGTRQNADFQVMRFNANGSLDTTFDGDGILQTDMGTSIETAYGVAFQSDGKIVAAGGTNNFVTNAPGDFALARYNVNGSLDTTFDGDGKVFTDFGGRPEGPSENAQAIAIQGNGRIVVAGQTADPVTTTKWDFAAVRYLTNGSLDTSFDGDGKAVREVVGISSPGVTGDVQVDDVAIAPSGEIVIAGWSWPAGFSETIVRFQGDGTPDRTFGDDGLALPELCPGEQGKLTGLAIGPDRKLIVIGQNCAGNLAPVARLNGTSASLYVTPNTELDADGQTVQIGGLGWPAGVSVQIQQCDETVPASPVCAFLANATTDTSGIFQTSPGSPPELSYALTGGSCPDPSCKIVVTATTGEVVKAPVSFKETTSLRMTPSRGAIVQGDSVPLDEPITLKVDATAAFGTPTGQVSFFICGPMVHPTTCSAGGSSLGTVTLVDNGFGTSSATSGPIGFVTPGRYCFRAVFPGNNEHRPATDSSREACVSVRDTPGAGPLAADDFFEGIPGQQIQSGAPGVLMNDLAAPGQTPTAQLVSGPANGTLVGGLNSNGAFTYQPSNGSVTADSFTYRAQDTLGLSEVTTVTLDLSGDPDTVGTRYKGTRYHGTRYKGTRYKGTRYKGTRYHGTRYKSLNDVAMSTYAECSPRWVWINPQLTFYEQTTAEVTAALYDAAGVRIAASEGFLADGEFYGDLSDPLNVPWPVWNAPVPAGGVSAKVFVNADPAEAGSPSYVLTNTVGCQT